VQVDQKKTINIYSGAYLPTFLTPSMGVSRFGALAATVLLAGLVRADLVVPSGGSYALNGGSTDLACTDVIVAGTLQIDSGSLTSVRNLIIQAGGSITATSGTISLSGDWSNAGSFSGGTGLVSFVDLAGCATAGGTISGNTTFANLSFISAIGKTYRIASDSSQTINQFLTIQGAPGLPLVLRGTTPGQAASITLLGGQSTSNFGAADLIATGNWIAPNQSNAIAGSGVTRIFGDPNAPIPTMPLGVLALLALALAAVVRRRLRP
jgi:MYXO-CTERM domain-containing protein